MTTFPRCAGSTIEGELRPTPACLSCLRRISVPEPSERVHWLPPGAYWSQSRGGWHCESRLSATKVSQRAEARFTPGVPA